MKVSVVIPTYNSAATIEATLNSVLSQTVPPEEILVLDDGSTDDTVSLLNSYKSRVTICQQKNTGVASARNALCARASGDFVAFLDHDDIWHPHYLEVQSGLFKNYSNAVAFFSGHVDFYGRGIHQWKNSQSESQLAVELIDPLSFLKRYNETTGPFGSMSYCCIPKWVLTEMGSEPFRVDGVDDSYLCSVLPLFGRPVIYARAPLVAYRITQQAQSANKLKALGLWVDVLQLIQERYSNLPDAKLRNAFGMAFASKRRSYGKILMGAGKSPEARKQFWHSLSSTNHPLSLAKSLGLLFWSYSPGFLQPTWPSSYRK